jgi:epsilon-lactone hydrolase
VLFLIFPLLLLLGLWLFSLWLFARLYLAGPDLSAWDRPLEDPIGDHPRPSAEHQRAVEAVRTMNRSIRSRPPWRRIAAIREEMEKLLGDREVSADVRPVRCDGVSAEWVLAAGCDPDRRMLYLHGGAFVAGSPSSHRPLCADLSRGARAAVLSVDYRLMPEHSRMAGVRDARTAYRWILEHGPAAAGPPARLFVAGDSAGGNLALVTVAWARDRGLRAPDAAVAFSPPTDGTFSSPTIARNLDSDVMLGPAFRPVVRWRTPTLLLHWLWLRKRPCDPVLSPVFGDLSGLPPLLIQASEAEVLVGDARRYANKARAAGSPVELETWRHMVHVFQALGDALPEAREAQARVFAFLERHAPGTDRATAGRGV